MANRGNPSSQTIQEMIAAEINKLDALHQQKIAELNESWEQRMLAYREELLASRSAGPDTEELVEAVKARVDPGVGAIVQQQMGQEMDKMMQEKIGNIGLQTQGSIPHKVARYVTQVDQSPFSAEILEESPPPKFQAPKITLYDGKSYPRSHILHVKYQMRLFPASDAFLCKVFTASLIEGAVRWFDILEPDSIRSFSDMCGQFMGKYYHQITKQKTSALLFRLRIGDREMLENFQQRFQDELTVADKWEPALVAQAFITAMQKIKGENSEAAHCGWELIRKDPKDMTSMLAIVHEWIKQEREQHRARGKRTIAEVEESKIRNGREKKPQGT